MTLCRIAKYDILSYTYDTLSYSKLQAKHEVDLIL